jgi:hypothetical protein
MHGWGNSNYRSILGNECFEIVKVINGCKEKIYGVRDEYGVSGYSVRIE